MAFVERDQKSPDTRGEDFHRTVRIRSSPAAPHRRSEDSYSEVRQPLVQRLRVDAIPVMDHEPIRMLARKRLPELLQGPLCRGMGGYVVMQNPSCSQVQDHEYVKDTEASRDHNEEVARQDHLGVVADKGQPALLRIGSPPRA